jgi:large subunit ribosomal protein L21
MYAIIEDSGTQIKASEGDELTIDLRELDDNATTITFDKVLAIGSGAEGGGGGGDARFGTPYLDGATVEAEILDRMVKGEKIDVVKFKRRKGYRRKTGHRQRYVKVKITKISG